MKKLSTTAIAVLITTLMVAMPAVAGQYWETSREGDSYLMFTQTNLRIPHSVGELNFGFLCAPGNHRIILMGKQVTSPGQLTYSIKVDEGEMFQGFAAIDEHNAELISGAKLKRLISQFKRGQTALVGARDFQNNVSVFEIPLAGFTKNFNQAFPSGCFQ